MATAIACFIALFSTSALIALWFWVVRRELYARQKTVDAAKRQLAASRQQYARVRDGPGEKQAREILERCQSVYRQAVNIYNEALCKPWNAIPALFLGYRRKNTDVTV